MPYKHTEDAVEMVDLAQYTLAGGFSVPRNLYVEAEGLMRADTQACERAACWVCSCVTSQTNLS